MNSDKPQPSTTPAWKELIRYITNEPWDSFDLGMLQRFRDAWNADFDRALGQGPTSPMKETYESPYFRRERLELAHRVDQLTASNERLSSLYSEQGKEYENFVHLAERLLTSTGTDQERLNIDFRFAVNTFRQKAGLPPIASSPQYETRSELQRALADNMQLADERDKLRLHVEELRASSMSLSEALTEVQRERNELKGELDTARQRLSNDNRDNAELVASKRQVENDHLNMAIEYARFVTIAECLLTAKTPDTEELRHAVNTFRQKAELPPIASSRRLEIKDYEALIQDLDTVKMEKDTLLKEKDEFQRQLGVERDNRVKVVNELLAELRLFQLPSFPDHDLAEEKDAPPSELAQTIVNEWVQKNAQQTKAREETSKAAPGFPYDHLSVLGFQKLQPYRPNPAESSDSEIRDCISVMDAWVRNPGMNIVVEPLLFSGPPNPKATLSETEVSELRRRYATVRLDRRPISCVIEPSLGYGGVLVTLKGKLTWHALQVGGGVVKEFKTDGTVETYEDRAHIEDFLCDCIEHHVPGVHDLIKDMKGPTPRNAELEEAKRQLEEFNLTKEAYELQCRCMIIANDDTAGRYCPIHGY
jgi:hypothetical protein